MVDVTYTRESHVGRRDDETTITITGVPPDEIQYVLDGIVDVLENVLGDW